MGKWRQRLAHLRRVFEFCDETFWTGVPLDAFSAIKLNGMMAGVPLTRFHLNLVQNQSFYGYFSPIFLNFSFKNVFFSSNSLNFPFFSSLSKNGIFRPCQLFEIIDYRTPSMPVTERISSSRILFILCIQSIPFNYQLFGHRSAEIRSRKICLYAIATTFLIF